MDRTLNLVDVLTEISVEIAIVVAEVRPFQLAHRELRGKAEGSLTDVLLRNKAFESLPGDDKSDLVVRSDPSRIAALSETVRDRGLIDRVDHRGNARGGINRVEAQRLLIDTKGEPAIPHELVPGDALLAEVEGTCGEIQQILFDVRIVADVLDGVGASQHLEELALLGSEGLGKHLLAEEGADPVQGLEVQRAVRIHAIASGREQGVDLLHVPGQVRGERLGAVDRVLDTRLNEVLVADVGVDQLQDGLLKGDLSLQVAPLECGPSLLDADAGARTTQGSKLELILGRTDLVRSSTDAAEVKVWDKCRGCKRRGGHGHFLDDRTNDVRDVGDSSAINAVDVGTLAGKNLGDLTNDAVNILGSKVLYGSNGDTVVVTC